MLGESCHVPSLEVCPHRYVSLDMNLIVKYALRILTAELRQVKSVHIQRQIAVKHRLDMLLHPSWSSLTQADSKLPQVV